MTEAERIARVLCRSDGHEPDEMVVRDPPAIGAFGYVAFRADHAFPQWKLYTGYVVGVLREINPNLDPKEILAGAEAQADPDAEPEPTTVPWQERYGLSWPTEG